MEETLKFDSGKVEFSDIPQMTMRSVAQVFNYGAKKYAKFNYSGGTNHLRYYDACQRHLHSWMTGEDLDLGGSNLPHLDHAICSLMMLRENIHMGKGTDNRNKLYKKDTMSDGDFQVLKEEGTYGRALVEKGLGVVYSQPEKESSTQMVIMLTKMYSNDAELGAAIRKAYGQKPSKEEILEKEMD